MDLPTDQFPFLLLCDRFQRRRDPSAIAAPWRSEIHQHRQLCLEYKLLIVLFRYCDHCHIVFLLICYGCIAPDRSNTANRTSLRVCPVLSALVAANAFYIAAYTFSASNAAVSPFCFLISISVSSNQIIITKVIINIIKEDCRLVNISRHSSFAFNMPFFILCFSLEEFQQWLHDSKI